MKVNVIITNAESSIVYHDVDVTDEGVFGRDATATEEDLAAFVLQHIENHFDTE